MDALAVAQLKTLLRRQKQHCFRGKSQAVISLLKAFNIMSENLGKKNMNDYSLGKSSSSGNLFSLTHRPVPILALMRLYFLLLGNPYELPNERRDTNSSVCGEKSH